jgi:hypothetical protein
VALRAFWSVGAFVEENWSVGGEELEHWSAGALVEKNWSVGVLEG